MITSFRYSEGGYKMKYFEALKSGRELVVIASDEACDSAIFHMGTDGTLYTYTVNFGEFHDPPNEKAEGESLKIICKYI